MDGWNICDTRIGRRWDLPVGPATSWPAEMGRGNVRLLGMQRGFQFCAIEGQMSRAARVFFTDPSDPQDRVAMLLVATLDGELAVRPGGHHRAQRIPAGTAFLCGVPEPTMTVELPPARHRAMDVGISRSALQRVGEEMPLPQSLRRIAEGLDAEPLALPGRIDRRLALTMEELMNNPFRDGAARLFQEAKGLELLAQVIDALDEQTTRRTRWRHQDVARLEEMRLRLTTELQNPPELAELARDSGMSATKIKRGFRDLFDTTVSDTAREARLQQARQLLLNGDLPLKAIAARCGFADPASLSHAFVRRFGCTPGSLRVDRVDSAGTGSGWVGLEDKRA